MFPNGMKVGVRSLLLLAIASLGSSACTGDDGMPVARTAPSAPRVELAPVASPPHPDAVASVLLGRSAPAIDARSASGRDAVVIATKGDVLVLHFWATWCEPCKRAMRALDALGARNAGRVRVVGLSVDDEPDLVEEFARAQGIRFPVAWDRGLVTANRYQPATMPTTYVIDAAGVVRHVAHGYQDGDDVEIERQVALLASPR